MLMEFRLLSQESAIYLNLAHLLSMIPLQNGTELKFTDGSVYQVADSINEIKYKLSPPPMQRIHPV